MRKYLITLGLLSIGAIALAQSTTPNAGSSSQIPADMANTVVSSKLTLCLSTVTPLPGADGGPFTYADGGPYEYGDGGPYSVGDGGPFTYADGGPTVYSYGDGGPYSCSDAGPYLYSYGDGGPYSYGDGGPYSQAGPYDFTDAGPVTYDAGPVTYDAGPGNYCLDGGPVTYDAGPSELTLDAGPATTDAGPVTYDAGPITLDAGPEGVISVELTGRKWITYLNNGPNTVYIGTSATIFGPDGGLTQGMAVQSGQGGTFPVGSNIPFYCVSPTPQVTPTTLVPNGVSTFEGQ